MSTEKADEHCARLELGRHCSVVWLISVLGALGATAQLGHNMARCGLERWAGKATVARHSGLVPVGGQRAARHGPGRARAQAQQRVPASMLDMLMNLLPSSLFRSHMCDKSN